MVDIEEKHLEIFNKLADELNISAKRFSQSSYTSSFNSYKKALADKNISVEDKKKRIVEVLHSMIVKTFSIELRKVASQKRVFGALKDNVQALRALVSLLRDINYYLQHVFLEELKLTKKSANIEKVDEKEMKKLAEDDKSSLGKKDFERLEHTVYKFIERLIFLDQKLLKRYKKQEEKLIKTSELSVNNISTMLKRESELLCHLEAKLPPSSKMNARLLTKPLFTEWVARITALMAAFENEYKKEAQVFEKLKRDRMVKKKINAKINHLIREKWELLKLKEARLLSMENMSKIEEEHQKISHSYASLLRL